LSYLADKQTNTDKNSTPPNMAKVIDIMITFRVSSRRREMYSGHASLYVSL